MNFQTFNFNNPHLLGDETKCPLSNPQTNSRDRDDQRRFFSLSFLILDKVYLMEKGCGAKMVFIFSLGDIL